MKKVEGAPETITQAQVVAACEALGLDPLWTRNVRIGVGYIEVTLHVSRPAKIKREEGRLMEHVICYDLLADD